MDRFLHTSIRLNTDLGRATRFFSQPDQMTRWLCSKAEASSEGFVMSMTGINAPEDNWKWEFEVIRREKLISAKCSNLFEQDDRGLYLLEIQLMKCTSLTEYCSEIHVIQRGFENSEGGDMVRGRYLELWKTKLEALRALVNGKWFIEDKDLTLDMFK